MFEHRHEPLLARAAFVARVVRHAGIAAADERGNEGKSRNTGGQTCGILYRV